MRLLLFIHCILINKMYHLNMLKKALTSKGRITPFTGDVIECLSSGYYTYNSTNEGDYIIRSSEPSSVSVESGMVGKVISFFRSSDRSVGVMLNGMKGSGKTTLCNAIARRLSGEMPVISLLDVNNFFSFIEKMPVTQCVVIIDEAEKKILFDESADFLSLMDGMSSVKFLFILTSNTEIGALRNRTGRIMFWKDMDTMSFQEIEGFIHNNCTLRVQEVIDFCKTLRFPTIDTVSSICKMSNMFPELSLSKACEDLNISFRAKMVRMIVESISGEVKTINVYKTTNALELNEYFKVFMPDGDSMYVGKFIGMNNGKIVAMVDNTNFPVGECFVSFEEITDDIHAGVKPTSRKRKTQR